MKNKTYFARQTTALCLFIACVVVGQAAGFASSFSLEGLNKGNTNNWVAGNLMNWQELDMIPCRVAITGIGINQTVTINFPHLTGTTPGFENLYSFAASPGITLVSPPVLVAPVSGAWSYKFTVNVTANGAVTFFARLAAGAHINVGSSLQIDGSPQSMGQLQIHKPQPGNGAPNLAVVKTGSTQVPQGGMVNYTLTYTNKATGTNIGVGVQISDILPPQVTVATNQLPANAHFAGNTIFFDMPNLAPGAGGQISFPVGVPTATPLNTVLTNFAQILSSQNDADNSDNSSRWATTVTNGCFVPLVTTPPADQTDCPGDTANFAITASGPSLTYQWYKGASLLSGETNATLTLNNVSATDAGPYSVVITGTCGLTVTNSATLFVNSNTLVSTAPVNATNCPGTTANFSVNANGTGLAYQWYKGASLLSGQTSAVLTLNNVGPTDAGFYNVVISGTCGATVTNSAALFVNENVLVSSAPSNVTNCPGTMANFNVSASGTGLAYQWYKGASLLGGQTSAVLTLNNVSPTDAGLYSVVISGTCGATVTNSATLFVNANVLVSSAPSNATNCPGTTANFSVNASGTGLAYQWYKGASLLGGQTSAVLTLNNVSATDAGLYSVVISGTCGAPVTNSAALFVNANVLVSSAPSNVTNCPGTTANFSVNASGAGLTYQWYKGAILLGGQTSATLILGNVNPVDAGIYRVVVSGTCGTPVTNSATLVVNSNSLVTVPPSGTTVCPGSTANFNVNATGTSLSYQWYKGTNLLGGQTNSGLTLNNVSALDAGTYSVVVSGVCGASLTNSATLTVNSNVVVSVPPSNSTNCPGTTVNFSVNATGTGLSHQWYKGANALAGQTTNVLTLNNVAASDAGSYSVVVTGICGAPVTNSASLVVNDDASVVKPPADAIACPGSTVNFSVNATGTGVSYQWYKGATLLGGEVTSLLNLPNVSSADAGIYSVVVSGICGAPTTNSATLTVSTNVLVTLPPSDATNCPGTDAHFSVNAMGTGLAYQWYRGTTTNLDLALVGETNSTLTLSNVTSLTAGLYRVLVTGDCGGAAMNDATLVVNTEALISGSPTDLAVCSGSAANFSVSATGTALTYQWYKGPNALAGKTTNILTLNNVSVGDAGTYSVVVAGVCGSPITNSATLTVNEPLVIVNGPSNSTNCPGTIANFSVNAIGTGLNYQWYKGASLLNGKKTSTLTLHNVTASDAGTYNVVINGVCGPPVTNSAILVANQNVSLASLVGVTNNIGTSTTFTAAPFGTGPFSYQWSKGATALIGQTNSMLTLNNLQPADNGAYKVTVTGACGPSATTAAVLTINQPPVASIVYPTNGTIFVDPATFTVLASASDPDGVVTSVEFFSSTNGVDFALIAQTNDTPYLTIASNLPAAHYTFFVRATDNLGATGYSAPVSVVVVPVEPPDLALVGKITLNTQDGLQWLTNVVCNPIFSHANAIRIDIHNITNSSIRVANASGTNNGVPFIISSGAIMPGECWTNVIKFYDPLFLAFSPVLTVQLVEPVEGPGEPVGTVEPIFSGKFLRDGTFLVEFTTVPSSPYNIQYSSDLIHWKTSFPPLAGTGQHTQWIDSGPPATESLPSTKARRFYRVLKTH